MKVHRGVKYDNKDTALIIRTTERPKYLEMTFHKTVETASPDVAVLVLNNCRDDRIREENRRIVHSQPLVGRFAYKEFSHLLGVPGSINTGVKLIMEEWPNTRRVFVCDDDCIPPERQIVDGREMHWDEVLSIMLEAGWRVASHPAKSDCYSQDNLEFIGNIEGHRVGHVGGAFSGFSVQDWKRVGGIPGVDKLFGFGPFCNIFKGQVGYWPDKRFQIRHLDDPRYSESLRKTEYFRWYRGLRRNQATKIEDEVDDKWK